MKAERMFSFRANIYYATLYQLAVAFLMLWLSRFFFIVYNSETTEVNSFSECMRLSFYGARFDLCALAYFNILFLTLRILPLPFQFSRKWLKFTDWVYYVCNSLMIAINIGDTPYYNFTGTRLRWSNVTLVATDSGIGTIFLKYLVQYWWIVILGIGFIVLMIWLSRRVIIYEKHRPGIVVRFLILIPTALILVICIRGRIGFEKSPPLSLADASIGTSKASQISVVLNSPFCLLRTMFAKGTNIEPVMTFFTAEELGSLRNSVHFPADSVNLQKRNIVTIIIESGGAEWVDYLTCGHKSQPTGLMPFLDSIAAQSTVVMNVMATGRTSIGGFTGVTGGFPAFDSFYYMLSPYNNNIVDAPARLLAEEGWETAFYYGVNPGSFTIDQTARAMGYKYVRDRHSYGNDEDFDGEWGIFDLPMAEYVVADLSKFSQPFMATWFTISAHGPFALPEGYDTSSFRHPEASPERGLEYTDVALRRFFELARREEWYYNTTFIITADHGNRDFSSTPYGRDYIRNRLPLIIFTPDGSIPAKIYTDRTVSQIDIAPTVLALTGYEKPFVSIGSNALGDPSGLFGIYRGDGGGYLFVDSCRAVYTDPSATKIESVYDPVADMFFEHPLEYPDSLSKALLLKGQALLQDYTERLNQNRMSFKKSDSEAIQ